MFSSTSDGLGKAHLYYFVVLKFHDSRFIAQYPENGLYTVSIYKNLHILIILFEQVRRIKFRGRSKVIVSLIHSVSYGLKGK